MKRFLLIALTALLSIPTWAVGNNSGTTKLNAIEFDWEHGNVQEGGTSPLWYRVDLTPLYNDIENPTLALYLTNLSTTNDATVTIKASLFGNTEEKTYIIGSKENKIWSIGASLLVETKTREIYLTLAANQDVALSANVYETEDIDDACVTSSPFIVAKNAQMVQGEGTSVWYEMNIADLRTGGSGGNSELVVTIHNDGTATATIDGQLSFDCPSTGTTDYSLSIGAGNTVERVIPRTMLEMLSNDALYLHLTH